ncbi:MAG TPA: ATP-dependent DNA helicase RecG, partial [Beutenbergiaceae bacterium]|nr:ATP-dependent DNA helicase RecG [Beutenbergiaceae bacterium]
TVMVIMDGHMFGLSQLHQLRGRIGRGTQPGVCLVVTDSRSATSLARLKAFEQTTDGFELAERDVHIRREGDVLGRVQSGRTSSLKLLRVMKDKDLIAQAREAAWALIDADPDLTQHRELAAAIKQAENEQDYLTSA